MRLLYIAFLIASIFSGQTVLSQASNNNNQCVTFTVGSGTGCAWMCNYCADQLGTNNYYFTDGVCTYQTSLDELTGGCVGNPVAGKQYTCCAVSSIDEL